MEEFIDKRFTYAVVGASKNQSKYGFKVLKDLKDAGFRVVPINPHETEILGMKCFKSLKDVDKKIDVVITVVPPKITEKIVEECSSLGIKKVWMQPGSEDEKAINFCKRNHINVVYNTCIMVEHKLLDKSFFI